MTVLAGNLQNSMDHGQNYDKAMSIIRLLVKKNGTKAHCAYRYQQRQGIKIAPASLSHSVLARRNSKTPILKLLNLILEHHPDLEDRYGNGNTPLLYAMFYAPQPALFDIVKALVEEGAKVDAVNNYNEGCLPFLRQHGLYSAALS